MDSAGRPRRFSAHGYADSDGGDCTPFLPPSLFSTDFVTPIDWEFLAFASNQPGTVTVGDTELTLEGVEGPNSVYKVRLGSGGGPGVRIRSSVPVWAVMESRADDDEQLLYGNIPPQIVDEDSRMHRLFVARSNGDQAMVASIVDDNEIFLNGASQGTLAVGQVWEGTAQSGDIFTASGPIYGVTRTSTGTHVMIPGRLKGTEFAIANDRRTEAHLYVNCLDVPCHVTLSTSGGVVTTRDVRARSFIELTVAGAVGVDQAIVVSSSAPLVLAIANNDDTDYMPVPPVSDEQFGIPSTVLSVATTGLPMLVDEACSDGSSTQLNLPGGGHQVEEGGHQEQYTGPACKYSSATTNSLGEPRGFSAHCVADGDGGDSTPFLPPSLFSTEFVTPIDWEFLAFVSNEPGTVTVGETEVGLAGSDGVFKARFGDGGGPGVRIVASVPVWAMMESAVDDDEQLLYGTFVL